MSAFYSRVGCYTITKISKFCRHCQYVDFTAALCVTQSLASYRVAPVPPPVTNVEQLGHHLCFELWPICCGLSYGRWRAAVASTDVSHTTSRVRCHDAASRLAIAHRCCWCFHCCRCWGGRRSRVACQCCREQSISHLDARVRVRRAHASTTVARWRAERNGSSPPGHKVGRRFSAGMPSRRVVRWDACCVGCERPTCAAG